MATMVLYYTDTYLIHGSCLNIITTRYMLITRAQTLTSLRSLIFLFILYQSLFSEFNLFWGIFFPEWSIFSTSYWASLFITAHWLSINLFPIFKTLVQIRPNPATSPTSHDKSSKLNNVPLFSKRLGACKKTACKIILSSYQI